MRGRERPTFALEHYSIILNYSRPNQGIPKETLGRGFDNPTHQICLAIGAPDKAKLPSILLVQYYKEHWQLGHRQPLGAAETKTCVCVCVKTHSINKKTEM